MARRLLSSTHSTYAPCPSAKRRSRVPKPRPCICGSTYKCSSRGPCTDTTPTGPGASSRKKDFPFCISFFKYSNWYTSVCFTKNSGVQKASCEARQPHAYTPAASRTFSSVTSTIMLCSPAVVCRRHRPARQAAGGRQMPSSSSSYHEYTERNKGISL